MPVLTAVEPLVRRLRWEPTEEGRHSLMWNEWIVTNGLGGYATGTVAGALTRRYHGMLVAALPTPFGRVVMLNYVLEQLRYPDGRLVPFATNTHTGIGYEFDGSRYLVGFWLEEGLPVWTYDIDGVQIEKRVRMLHHQNTTHVTYRLLSRES